MKFLINFFFILSILNLRAQTVQMESIVKDSVTSECIQIVKGEVRDKNTNDLLSDAEVVLSNMDGSVLQTQKVNEDATFSFQIQCETTYKLEGKSIDFKPESKHFTTSDEVGKELKLLILLGKGNIDFIADVKAVKTVDVVGVAEEGSPDEIKLENKIGISPNKEKPVGMVNVGLDPVYFDLASSYLDKKAKARLQTMVGVMKKYPKMVIELRAHSDAQGSDKINKWFADRRAKRTRDYMIKRGVEPSRITAKGYGATQLVNHCSRDVECTEEQHQKNRRTEFVIISM